MIGCEEMMYFHSQEGKEWRGERENFQKEDTLPLSWDTHMEYELVWSF
jgi:hypothetical protein